MHIISVTQNTKHQKEIPIVLHNGSNHDYHFIIREVTEVFKGQFKFLGENAEKYITFSVAIQKELVNGKTATYKMKFIDSIRFMASSLSNLTIKSC